MTATITVSTACIAAEPSVIRPPMGVDASHAVSRQAGERRRPVLSLPPGSTPAAGRRQPGPHMRLESRKRRLRGVDLAPRAARWRPCPGRLSCRRCGAPEGWPNRSSPSFRLTEPDSLSHPLREPDTTTRLAHRTTAGNAGAALPLAIYHPWLGVPEAGRWALSSTRTLESKPTIQ